jgi:hypoxanthine phosphoribosyltransferase
MTISANLHDDIEEIVITQNQLQTRVQELAQQIAADYDGKPLLLVGVLKGGVVFMTDLFRALDRPVEMDFMAVSSYGASTTTSGIVRILKDLDAPIEEKHVLLVEDIVDSGLTLRYIAELLEGRNPASLKVCVLLDKGKAGDTGIEVAYLGFTIPDRFVVGYGLDYDQIYRNLPYVGVLKPSVYAASGGSLS